MLRTAFDHKHRKLAERYAQRIQETPQEGTRHRWIFRAVCLAKSAGIAPHQAINDLQSISTLQGRDEQRHIEQTVKQVYEDRSITTVMRSRPRNIITPATAEKAFSEMVLKGRIIGDNESSERWMDEKDEKTCWTTWLGRLFTPETLLLGSYGEADDVRARQLHSAAEWMNLAAPRYIIPQAHSGSMGLTLTGETSLAAKSCFQQHQFLLVEMDSYPDGWTRTGKVEKMEQGAFLFFIDDYFRRKHKNLLELASITFSGGKSLHGLFRYSGKQEAIPAIFDALKVYGVDGACANINRWTRCPSGVRDDGTVQSLIWIR